ncbi:MAG: hypothetical protein RI988_2092 [Pseudomonadota bacterium]|jgi:AcrR family transcriptional regulator
MDTSLNMRVSKKAGYHHGDLRRALMDVSVEVIRKQGVDALNLRALATRLDVSSGAPYHHFANRAELLCAIALEGFELLQREMAGGLASAAADAGARLQALSLAYVRFASRHPGHFRVMFLAEVHREQVAALSQASRQSFDMLAEAVQACQREGAAPPGEAGVLTLTAWSLVHGLATLWVDGAVPTRTGHLDPATMAPLVTGLLVQMLAASAGAQAAPRPPRKRARAR